MNYPQQITVRNHLEFAPGVYNQISEAKKALSCAEDLAIVLCYPPVMGEMRIVS